MSAHNLIIPTTLFSTLPSSGCLLTASLRYTGTVFMLLQVFSSRYAVLLSCFIYQNAPVFSLDSASILNQSSSCDDPDLDHLLNFGLQPSGERLSLNFQINESNGDVTLFVYFRMDPSKHFKDMNESCKSLTDSMYTQTRYSKAVRCFNVHPPNFTTLLILIQLLS